MANFQRRIGKWLAAIPLPDILCPENLKFQLSGIFEGKTSIPASIYSTTDDALAFHSIVSPDLLPLLLELAQPKRSRTIYSLGLDSFSLGYLSPLVIEAERFPLTIRQVVLGVSPIQPIISDNLIHNLTAVRVLGMNYRDRIWRELRLPENEEPILRQERGTKPPIKSYKQRKGQKSKPKPPSFWDLLYAILQPPIVLEQLENLFLPHALYPFQPAGIEFLMNNESALLADEMGTGKTVMTTVALRILVQKRRVKHALVVCPLSVLREWDRHLYEWAPELHVVFVRGPRYARGLEWEMPAHVYVTTYDTLRSDIENGILSQERRDKFDIVVLDEAQNIKNPTSGRSRAVKKLKAGQRWALTGTPIENKIEDVAALFEFLRPGYLTPYDLYPARIKERIAPHFLRRRKADVLPDLPKKQKQDIWLELDSDQRHTYKRVAQEVRSELVALGPRVTKVDIFRNISRLKQICNFAPGRLTSPKLDALKEQIEEITESGQKVIVFSQYLGEGIDKLEETLRPYGTAKIVGGQTETIRNMEIDRFKASPETPLLLASVKAGGVGLNLTEASYVIHFDHWWNPAVMWQAEARVHRPGQTRGVNVYSYWMSDTIEERIYKMLQEKGLLFEDVIDGLSETRIDELISTDEWLDMLGVKHKEEARPEVKRETFASLDLFEIREKLYEITPARFEQLVKELLQSFGYPNVKVTGRRGDGGIDVLSTRNTTEGVVRAVAQCKRYRGTVGVDVARELMGVIAADKSIQKGFLATTGEFSRECIAFCEKGGTIVTISGLQMANYVRLFGLAV